MATTTTSESRNRSRGSNRRSGGRNNRGRSRNSNGNRNRSGGGGGRGGRRSDQQLDDNRPFRVPRPKKKPSLWARILGIFGIGKKPAAPKKRASTKPTAERRRREEKPRGPVELTAPRLFVGNLSYDATDADIENLLNGIGQVKSAEIVTNQRTQRSKGFAFVEMLSIDDARRAIDVLHNEQFLGRRLIVSPAKSEGVHPNAAANSEA